MADHPGAPFQGIIGEIKCKKKMPKRTAECCGEKGTNVSPAIPLGVQFLQFLLEFDFQEVPRISHLTNTDHNGLHYYLHVYIHYF